MALLRLLAASVAAAALLAGVCEGAAALDTSGAPCWQRFSCLRVNPTACLALDGYPHRRPIG